MIDREVRSTSTTAKRSWSPLLALSFAMSVAGGTVGAIVIAPAVTDDGTAGRAGRPPMQAHAMKQRRLGEVPKGMPYITSTRGLVSPDVPVETHGASDEPFEEESPQEAFERRKELLLSAFQNETRDRAWASESEDRLEEQFENSEVVSAEAEVELQGVECRSTQCLVELEFNDRGAFDRQQRNLRMRRVFDLENQDGGDCALHAVPDAPIWSYLEEPVTEHLIFRCPSRWTPQDS